MEYSINNNDVLLRLDPGDEIIDCILKVAREANITNAEETQGTDNPSPLYYGIIMVGQSGEVPVLNQDYTLTFDPNGNPVFTVKTPNWVLTGTATNEDQRCALVINTNKIIFSNLTIRNVFMSLEFGEDVTGCEIVLQGGQTSETHVSKLSEADNVNLTLSGDSKLHIEDSSLTLNILTINGVTLEVFNVDTSLANKDFT